MVTNNTVAPLYLDKVVDALTRGNPNVSVDSVILPDGEKYKNMVGLMKIQYQHFPFCLFWHKEYRNDILLLMVIGNSYESL